MTVFWQPFGGVPPNSTGGNTKGFNPPLVNTFFIDISCILLMHIIISLAPHRQSLVVHHGI